MDFFFYSRISTVTQNAERQTSNFKRLSTYKSENHYSDKIQGNIPFMERPGAAKLFGLLTSAHWREKEVTLVIDSIDRLGRNLVDILHTIECFTQNGINVQSIKEGFQTIVNEKENPIAKVVIAVMASIAEMERNRIKERTQEGITIAKAHGRFKGRKLGSCQSESRLLERHPVVVQKLKSGLSYRDISAITGKSSATVAKVKKVMKKRSLLST